VNSIAILTPSYAPDFELCSDLNRSVLERTPPNVHHHVIVPTRDKKLFATLRDPRTEVWTVDQFMPSRMVAVPRANLWLNLCSPYPPVRGWVMQQLIKLRAAVELGADVVVLADSDVIFVRPVTIDTFCKDGRLRFYRHRGAVDDSMPRHRIWHDVARRLLGLPPAAPAPLSDYISAFNVWDRRVVLALRDRIEEVNGRPWLDAIAKQLHLSEFILYGVFVEAVLGASAEILETDSMLCHSYWDPAPLCAASAGEFVQALPPGDVAVMISAKSRTPLDVRREALSGLRLPAPLFSS
jgi:hypothetical protein